MDSRLRTALVAVAAIAALMTLPVASAHGAEDPIAVETEVLADEGEDAFYFYDGYDLFNLFVREAYWEPLDQEGVIFRYTLYGGFSSAPTADALHIDVGPEGGPALRMTTTDDQSWTGDLTVVFADIVADEPPFMGYTAKLQVFAPYEALGVSKGDTLGPLSMASYAGADLVDIAPGGFFLPHTAGMGEVPAESTRLVDSLDLTGPTGYITWRASHSEDTLTIVASNVLEDTGQHIKVVPGTAPGWTVAADGPTQVSVDGAETASFRFQATADETASEPLPIAIVTDVGGREWLYLGVNGTTYQIGSTAEGVEVRPEVPSADSPGVGAWTLFGLVGLAAFVARRR